MVFGGLIGVTTHWLSGQYASYWRAIITFAVTLPVLLVFVELLRVLAAWYTGGWEGNMTSAAIGGAGRNRFVSGRDPPVPGAGQSFRRGAALRRGESGHGAGQTGLESLARA